MSLLTVNRQALEREVEDLLRTYSEQGLLE